MNKIEYMPEVSVDEMKEYVDALKPIKNKTDRDKRFLSLAKELFKGQIVINMRETIIKGGFHKNNIPKLAVARADMEIIYCRTWDDGDCVFMQINENTVYRFAHHIVRSSKRRTFSTLVPVVPPSLRPADKLENYHILFEAKEWKPEPMVVDPILCKHLHGDLFIVIAEWDMTPLEAFATGL
ncbi:MAG: hypothetical protein ACXACD_22460 [Candidatus Thorarchaeota archaeon]|jgi:hypothetical protein